MYIYIQTYIYIYQNNIIYIYISIINLIDMVPKYLALKKSRISLGLRFQHDLHLCQAVQHHRFAAASGSHDHCGVPRRHSGTEVEDRLVSKVMQKHHKSPGIIYDLYMIFMISHNVKMVFESNLQQQMNQNDFKTGKICVMPDSSSMFFAGTI